MQRRRERERGGGSFNRSLGMAPPGPFSEKASQRFRNYTNTVPGPWKSGRMELSTQFWGKKNPYKHSVQLEYIKLE